MTGTEQNYNRLFNYILGKLSSVDSNHKGRSVFKPADKITILQYDINNLIELKFNIADYGKVIVPGCIQLFKC